MTLFFIFNEKKIAHKAIGAGEEKNRGFFFVSLARVLCRLPDWAHCECWMAETLSHNRAEHLQLCRSLTNAGTSDGIDVYSVFYPRLLIKISFTVSGAREKYFQWRFISSQDRHLNGIGFLMDIPFCIYCVRWWNTSSGWPEMLEMNLVVMHYSLCQGNSVPGISPHYF